ncbi:universal stress protein [Ligilactobacillus equi]|uniref:Universal stress protein UspA family protein n=2 Tax=Ligilactobacillus equi TaxID=137357 RepID=V7HZT7_9LACO|nr:universal stress protein [Ligilactobacillus equi]ETA74810.1 universal stress protein UspA family protein [Ligilactobacillus equi DPC 6820]KRL85181.1 universal stress protein UspA family protein [Ligilactobacillus equi DSM 15833 = JCM 10991]MCQ2556601.1 universal stress protein [Ligilactobacillus sp.]
MPTLANFEIKPLTFSKILVAVDEDDSISSIRAFNYAVTTAKRLNIPLGIVSVMEINEFNVFDALTHEVYDLHRDTIQRDLARYVNKAKSFGVEDVTSFTGEGVPAKVIINEIIPQFQPDLLVCGSETNKHHGHVFIGSQASALAQNAPCSVSVIR